MINIFLSDPAFNKAGRLVPDFFLFFKKGLCKIKASGQHLSFNIFGSHRLRHTIKANCRKFQTVDSGDPQF